MSATTRGFDIAREVLGPFPQNIGDQRQHWMLARAVDSALSFARLRTMQDVLATVESVSGGKSKEYHADVMRVLAAEYLASPSDLSEEGIRRTLRRELDPVFNALGLGVWLIIGVPISQLETGDWEVVHRRIVLTSEGEDREEVRWAIAVMRATADRLEQDLEEFHADDEVL